jgi:predicted DsbA family dithiol-disulfide isomerase
VTWLPFRLHPEYPAQGIPRSDLVARYGDSHQERLREQFAAEGLDYAPPPEVVPNTALALEVGEQARSEGLHRAYHDRVMDAYWSEGANVGERSVLSALAREVGVSEDGIALALDDRVRAAEVDAWTARAHASGVTGVPAFLLERRLLVVGAYPRETLARALEQARGR